MKEKLAFLISGSGTTMEIIIEAMQAGLLTMDVACIIASSRAAKGIERAKTLGIPFGKILVIDPKAFRDKNGKTDEARFGNELLRALKANGATLIGQYGWLPKTPMVVIDAYKNRIINQHPGPLDPGRQDFGGKGMYGKRVHYARLFFVNNIHRDFWTEAVSHRVVEEFDKGPLLRTAVVDILPNDTPVSLQERVLEFEYATQIYTLLDFQEKRVTEKRRDRPLVLSDEEKLLDEAKKKAGQYFPFG